MSSSARQTAPHKVPPGVRLVLYACLPASLGEAADRGVASAQRYVADADWEAVETYADRAAPFESHAPCEGRRNALAAVEQGRAAGIIPPARDAGPSGGGQGEPRRPAGPDRRADHDAVGGRRLRRLCGHMAVGGVMTTMRQGSLRQLLGQVGWVLRHPAKYVGRFGFGAFQMLFLPVLVTGTTLTMLYTGQLR
jgi:hypothetical protein